MKRIFILILTLCSVTACSFLDKEPYTQVLPENFYKTENDFKLATIGAYETLNASSSEGYSLSGGTYHCGLPIIMNSPSDELFCYYDATDSWGQFTQMINASFTQSNTGLRRMWDAFFIGIGRCNAVISYAENFKDNDNIQEYSTEARFLRGLYYWYLAQTFGGVPIVTYKGPGTESRSDLKTVYGYILSDLEYAAENLPAEKAAGAIGVGSATKYTAEAYIGKICNYLSACKKSGIGMDLVAEQPLNDFSWVDADAMSEKAYNALKDVVENSPYSLVSEFTNLFRETTKADQHQECLLMAETYLTSTENAFPSTTSFALSPQSEGVDTCGQTGAVYARYAMPTPKLFGMFSPKDPRRDWFCCGSAIGSIKKGTIVAETASDGYIYVKPNNRGTASSDSRVDSPDQTYLPFLNPTNASVGKFRFTQIGQLEHINNQHSLSFPLMRMAEVHLLYAEAIYYHKVDEAAARDELSKVLKRACRGDEALASSLASAYAKTDFIEELLESRERELCYEGTRKFDLFRFNKLDKAITDLCTTPIAQVGGKQYFYWNAYLRFEDKKVIGFDPIYFEACANALKRNWSSYKIWAPISSLQISANPNLKQNAKW